MKNHFQIRMKYEKVLKRSIEYFRWRIFYIKKEGGLKKEGRAVGNVLAVKTGPT